MVIYDAPYAVETAENETAEGAMPIRLGTKTCLGGSKASVVCMQYFRMYTDISFTGSV